MAESFKFFLSQHLDLPTRSWQNSGCGVSSLLMVMKYWQDKSRGVGRKLPDLSRLYQIGLNRRSYVEGVGWRHTGLVGLAKIYGFKRSKNYDLSVWSDAEARGHLEKALKTGPVIVSVYEKYQPQKGGGHLAVLLSLSDKKAVIYDPDSKTRAGVRKDIPTVKFLAAWKKRYIVVRA